MFNNNYTGKPTRGLVASYPLDGNANASVGTNGTATNITWVKTNKGYQNQCGSFNGISSKIVLPQTNMGSIFSISYNIFTPSTTGWQMIYSTSDGTNFIECGYNSVLGITFRIPGTGVIFAPASLGNTYSVVCIRDGVNGYIYVNGKLITSTSDGNTNTFTSTSRNIGYRQVNNDQYFNGPIQNVDIYNVALTEDEIRNLYLEGQRQLGNGGSYPLLLSGLIGYFRAEDVGGTTLYNLVNGITATRIGGTNTVDNLGNNQAILNPNYTWDSLTYTTGYTFENSGSGWNIVTSPAGLSATGINRTITLRDIFLFNITLSANEVTQLQDLCNKEIIYPSKVYDLPNLRDGLVLDLNAEGKDLSGNLNNGTLVNGPTVVRQGRSKGLSYNGSNQYTLLTNNNNLKPSSTKPIYFSCGVKITQTPSIGGMIATFGYENGVSLNSSGFIAINNTGTITITGSGTNAITSTISINDGKYHRINIKLGASAEIWIDGILRGSGSLNFNAGYSTLAPTIGITLYGSGSPVYHYSGQIFNPRIRNRVLSDKEIQQLYYKDKANFIY